eukprot:TRINITY_DN10157_c0_g1_i1.p1 TRINITY_DN10157_c0_g1~~TRINITY_DN10157_c0_g1_i1.p1  ORF type:complete len:283 (+),score=77.82 TRINITY_DN10157_c0_g1_i1:44-892(+)
MTQFLLIRVPSFVAEELSKAAPGERVAQLDVSADPSSGRPQKYLRLLTAANIPKEFLCQDRETANTMAVFTEKIEEKSADEKNKSSSSSSSVKPEKDLKKEKGSKQEKDEPAVKKEEIKCKYEGPITSVMDTRLTSASSLPYIGVLDQRLVQSSTKLSTSKDMSDTEVKALQLQQRSEAFKKFQEREKSERETKKERRVREPESEVRLRVLNAFQEQEYWRRKELATKVGQPEDYLSTFLDSMATFVRNGEHANTYKLRPVFSVSSSSSSSSSSDTNTSATI